ncbi:MAG TPA: hypothetical protein VN714_17550, partial [Trebonia sp.]|nr:hypothetical protein [Trebonia sp.]
MSACAVARAAVAAARTVSHACVAAGGSPALAWARILGQAGSRSALLRSTQRTHAERPGRTSGPTTPIASSARTTRCGTRSRVSPAASSGSCQPV